MAPRVIPSNKDIKTAIKPIKKEILVPIKILLSKSLP